MASNKHLFSSGASAGQRFKLDRSGLGEAPSHDLGVGRLSAQAQLEKRGLAAGVSVILPAGWLARSHDEGLAGMVTCKRFFEASAEITTWATLKSRREKFTPSLNRRIQKVAL